MRDLEIRGAGNLLGAEQSGHMMDVGYDMYLKLLEEAVLEEKGEKPPVRTECAADLSVTANIPEKYVPSAEQQHKAHNQREQFLCFHSFFTPFPRRAPPPVFAVCSTLPQGRALPEWVSRRAGA